MRTIAITELIPDTVDVSGALDFDERGSGLAPRRLPAWTRLQMPAVMDAMVRMPSGVRLRFATDSRRVGVHFLATNMVIPARPRRPVAFNCEAGGELQAAASTQGNAIVLKPEAPGGFELLRGEPDSLVFDVPAGAPGVRDLAAAQRLRRVACPRDRRRRNDLGTAPRDATPVDPLRQFHQSLHGGRRSPLRPGPLWPPDAPAWHCRTWASAANAT